MKKRFSRYATIAGPGGVPLLDINRMKYIGHTTERNDTGDTVLVLEMVDFDDEFDPTKWTEVF